ncbi:MAG: aromatic-ring-hydroxylating dioxygenase subunit beta [Pseudomonadota bacterium]
MSGVAGEVLSQIEELQLRYISALDKKDMKGWLGTFSEAAEASYLCVTADSVDAKLPLALIMDDCRGRLEDRVMFITKMWAGTFQDYRTRHFVQRIACIEAGPDLYEVESNFMIAITPSDTGHAELFSTGVYVDQVKIDGSGARYLSKKVITDVSVLPRYMVYPL